MKLVAVIGLGLAVVAINVAVFAGTIYLAVVIVKKVWGD